MRGTRPVDICKMYGVNTKSFKTRMYRGGWASKRLAILEVAEAKQATKSIQTMANKATSYLERVVKEVDKGMNVLETQHPATAKELNEHFDALGKIDKVARPALGLSSEGNGGKSSVVNVAVLQQFADIEPQKSIVVDNQQLTTEVDAMPIVRLIKEPHSSPLSVEPNSQPSQNELASVPDQLSE